MLKTKIKPIYKSTKVIYNAQEKQYEVWYRNWFRWHFDSCFKYDDDMKRPLHFSRQDEAESRAISRAEALLRTVVIWENSRIDL